MDDLVTRFLEYERRRQERRYYVYTLAYPDGTVFYVGKGSKGRIENHEVDALNFFRPHTYRTRRSQIIRQIYRSGGKLLKQKMAFFEDEHEAYEFEKQLIAFFGRENLTNRTNGGG